MFNLFKRKSKEIHDIDALPDETEEQYQGIKVDDTPEYKKALRLKEICSHINNGTSKRYSETIDTIRILMTNVDAFNKSLESYSKKVHYELSENKNKYHIKISKKQTG